MNNAWQNHRNVSKDDRLARHYTQAEIMMRLGTYRKTRFSDRYGVVVSAPAKAQRSIFLAFGIEVAG